MATVSVIRFYMYMLLLVLLQVVSYSYGTTYNGNLIGTFGPSTQHSVAGSVYAVDSNTIRIIGFSYDGTAPDAFLWGDESDTMPTSSGFIIPVESGSTVKLGQYLSVDIEVDLPAGKTITSLNWISVWCRQYRVDFGHVEITADFVAPAEYNLGTLGFTPRVHNVYASAVRILNAKQIRFENLDYDGFGPAAYFWVGPGDTPSNSNGYQIPDENGSDGVLSSYNDDTITLTLPGELTVFDFGHIGLWCVRANQDFGHLDVPAQLNIPPFALTSAPPATDPPTTAAPETMAFPNCETLIDGELQVSWKINGSDIIVQLSSTTVIGNYVAFGVSGSTTSPQMIGGDVTVTFIASNNQPEVVDYYLSDQSQCSPQDRQGACPDNLASNQAGDDVTLVGSVIDNGITTITYKRPLAARDATYDKEIPTDRSIYAIWARGGINADGRVAYHNRQRTSRADNLQINFGRESSSCPRLVPAATDSTNVSPVNYSWLIPGIVALENTTFVAQMGLAGGQKGYDAITGRVGWGIAFFIDDLLIPEITITRGRTYTFLVSGGNDSAFSANYHPFYITNDENGGYAQLTDEERRNITIYAGPVEGPLCQWTITAATQPAEDYTTFEEFRATLEVNCQPGAPAELVWTVADDTPDLVYYHCYTHRFLGWKIHVVDEDYVETTTQGVTTEMNAQSSTSASSDPSSGTTQEAIVFPNCETLVEGDLQVCWKINGSDIILQLSSDTNVDNYVAFGVSGSTTTASMVGGDVTVTFIDSNNNPQAVDYYLSSRSSCSQQNGMGACPDASIQASDDVTLLGSVIKNGVTSVTYKRPLAAQDAVHDKEIPTDRSIYVIWARGAVNADGSIAYHNERTNDNLQINFGRQSPTEVSMTTEDGGIRCSLSFFLMLASLYLVYLFL